jgi:hypothetical protein
MVVTLIDNSGVVPVNTVLDPSLYQVTGVGNENGGSVKYPITGSGISSSYDIRLDRIVPFTQDTDLTNQDNFNADVIEGALDSLEYQLQQMNTAVEVVPNLEELVSQAQAAANAAEQAAGMIGQVPYVGTSIGGTANAQVVGVTNPSGYSRGLLKTVTYIPTIANTGPGTANVAGTGASPLRKSNANGFGLVALEGYEIIVGVPVTLIDYVIAYVIVPSKNLPSVTVDNALLRSDGARGDVQSSPIIVSDTGNLATPGSITQTATDAETIPAGTVAQRPAVPVLGMVRHCSNIAAIPVVEHYNGVGWRLQSEPLLHLRDQRASGVAGAITPSDVWTALQLQTELTDEIGSTLTSFQFTLPAGTYDVAGFAQSGSSGTTSNQQFRARLRNITDSTDALIGQLVTASSSAAPQPLHGRITIAAVKTFEFQQYGTEPVNPVAMALGPVEVYSELIIRKIY